MYESEDEGNMGGLCQLSNVDRQLVETEQKILQEVLGALHKEKETQISDVGLNRDAFLGILKDSGRSSETDLPALLQELQIKRSLENRQRPSEIPSVDTPYFARLVLQEEEKKRTLLLGYSTFLSNHCRFPIVDWRNAPAAKLFYQYREGDEFEQELPERIAEGRISHRHILTIFKGRLEQIQTPKYSLARNGDGIWERREAGGRFFARGNQKAIRGLTFGVGLTGGKSPEVSALLDESQFALLNEHESKPLLILGGAGSGKTTIALHRVATLAFRNPKVFNEKSMVVIVPDEGLARLSRNLLKIIGMKRTQVATFDQWIHKQGRIIIKGLPTQLCGETPPRVIAMKRHPAMMRALGIYLDVLAVDILKRLANLFPSAAKDLSEINLTDFNHKNPMSLWLEGVKDVVSRRINTSDKSKLRGINEAFGAEKRRLFRISDDRKTLFSDRFVLQKGAEGCHDIQDSAIDEVVAHMREQGATSSAKRYSDVDQDRRVGLDGVDISQESEGVSGTIDVEDYPILFEILRRKVGEIRTPNGALHKYAHMVLDEAQELAPLELGVLSMALAEPRSVSIAGDSAQQTDISTSFESWENVLGMLDIKGVQAAHLTTNYRSPAPVSEFAHEVLGELAGQAPKATKDGAPVIRSEFKSYGEAIIVMYDILVNLMDTEPHASIAVVARTAKSAKQIYQGLKEIPEARLVENGQFIFVPGIDVTHVADIKGLEFDYVVIPDADSHVYCDDSQARRTLHVACTRAVHQLLVISTATPSVILPKRE